jgi:hypothetical protein
MAHRFHWINRLVRTHDFEDFGGTASVSRANQAAAFPEEHRDGVTGFPVPAATACFPYAAGPVPPFRLGSNHHASDQFQDLLAKLLWIGLTASGHFFAPFPKPTTVHFTGATPQVLLSK